MLFFKKALLCTAVVAITLPSANSGIFRKKKYENPVSKDTLQPDKVLFDRAVNDIEHGRFEVARLTLNTLINTYDSSEFLAKAKLAIADSWYREGGAHGLAQAEAEYKDFELFYPNMGESAEAQWRVCQIHYKQMEKVDRDSSQALRAEDECMQMVTAYPNSRYTAEATQMLRNVQEVLADKEYRTGAFYYSRGAFPAAQNRLAFVTQQFPLFSGAPDALWLEADSFRRMGDRFEDRQAEALTKLVRDYPLSDHVDDAKTRLTDMKKPIPGADPAAYARMKYDLDNAEKPGFIARATDFIKRGPDTHLAARNGAPPMQILAPPTPVSVPAVAVDNGTGGTVTGGNSDVTASTVSNSTAIDTQPDARPQTGASGSAESAPPGTPNAGSGNTSGPGATGTSPNANVPPPTNHPAVETKKQRKMKKKQLDQIQKQQDAAAQKTPPVSTPEASGAAATMTGSTPAATGSANAAPAGNPRQ